MAKRIAITIAGAVSLGSYEAGVLYELLRALRTYNEAAKNDDGKIYIDVLTGASAGGMTAAILAQRLMFDKDSLEGETTNVLYKTWVEGISLKALVELYAKEKRWHSLLSSDLIHSIGRAVLVESMRGPGSGPHAAVERTGGADGAPLPLRLGMALTNLNGVDYMIPIAGVKEEGFNYTTSVDQKIFTVAAARADTDWRDVCDTAVACGAFPVAFRPKDVRQRLDDFVDSPDERLPKNPSLRLQGKTYIDWPDRESVTFACSDGGILQNQPLGIAKNLVDDVVRERLAQGDMEAVCDDSDRLYVFVAPHSVKSTAQRLQAENISIWKELVQLFNVYTRQATFHDWIEAEELNQDVRFLDSIAAQLAELIARGYMDTASLNTASGELNSMLMANREQEHLQRLKKQYSASYEKVLAAAGQDAADAFLRTVATLEAAARLEDHDKMKIAAVIANAHTELAGSGMAAFLGFFKQSFREHDYWVGRKKTRAYLKREDVKGILNVTEWPEESTWRPLPNPSGITTLPVGNWEVFRAAIVPSLIFLLKRPGLALTLAVVVALIAYPLVRTILAILK